MNETRIASNGSIKWRLYMMTLCSLILLLLLLPHVQGQPTWSTSTCTWCRRVDSKGEVENSLCTTCSGSQYLCSYLYSIGSTCNTFNIDSPYRGAGSFLTANCKSGSSADATVPNRIRLDDFLGNNNGKLTLGETGFSQLCTSTIEVSGTQILLKATCESWYRGTPTSNTLDLSSILVNIDGVMLLIASYSGSTPRPPTDSYQISLLSACVARACSEGFLRTSEGACLRCNETAPVTPSGQYCDGMATQPRICPAGYYCNGSDSPKQLCQAGCLCEQGSATACPKQCPGGKLCRPGQAMTDCAENTYCPAGLTSDPLPCDIHCLCGSSSSEACPVACPSGAQCWNGTIWYCELGHWCANSVQTPCPAGTHGDRYGLKDSSCAGQCGVMWTSEPGSLVCDKHSQVGMFLLTLIPVVSLAVVIMVVGYITSKVRQHYPSLSNPPLKVIDASSPERDRIQRQIRNSVDAFVARVVKLSFPSVMNLSSTLLQLKLSKPEHVTSSMNEARDELSSHLVSKLLTHPQVSFDDVSYSWRLPRWASQDPESVEGEYEIVAASNTLATSLKPAVEQDLLEWFRSRNTEDNDSSNSQSMGRDEAKDSLIVASESSSEYSPSSWSTVDHELAVTLRTMLSSPSGCGCLSALRVDYSNESRSHKVFTKFFQLIFECIAITACIKCFIGDPLLKVTASDMTARREFQFSWDQSGPQSQNHWWDFMSSDANIFQPVTDQCIGVYGRVYFVFHLIGFILFFILASIDLISWCNAIMQCSRLGRGCRHRMRLVWKQYISHLPSIQHRLQDVNWSKYEGIEATARLLSPLCLVVAITVYMAGCITRMKLTPAQAISNDLHRPYYMDYMINGSLVLSSYDPSTAHYWLTFTSRVDLGATFILSVVAFALTLIPSIIMFQCWHQSRKALSHEQDVDGNSQLENEGAAIAQSRNIGMIPFSTDSGSTVSSRSLVDPNVVVFHPDAAIALPVESASKEQEGDIGPSIDSPSLPDSDAPGTTAEVELSVLTPTKVSSASEAQS